MTSESQATPARILSMGARRPASSEMVAKAVWGRRPLPSRGTSRTGALIAFPARTGASTPDRGDWGPAAA
ncbi:MAG TPA: hypothetical protein VIC33_05645 [Vicinamibacterales bacterium]|jgi:hypothetical protein